MSTPAPLDGRACALLDALRRLYDELDPDAWPVGVSIQALAPDGQVLTYGVTVAEFGGGEIVRYVTDVVTLTAATSQIAEAFDGVITDATVRDGPP